MKPYQINFDRMMSIANQKKANGIATTLADVMAEAGVNEMQWRMAMGKTRKNSPELFAMFYRALGVEPPPPPKEKPARDDPEEVEVGGIEEEEAEDDAPPSDADILSNVVAWISQADEDARPRILAAAGVFCGISGATHLLSGGPE